LQKDSFQYVNLFDKSYTDDLDYLRKYVDDAKSLKNGILGYLGKKKDVARLNQDFRKKFSLSEIDNPHRNLKEIEDVIVVYEYILELDDNRYHPCDIDLVHIVTESLKNDSFYFSNDDLSNMTGSLEFTKRCRRCV